ncbi:MAG: hypothetical protein AABZ12_12560 [Planctomycetota bacterium]
MHGDLFLVVVVLVFGCAAFVFGLVYLVCAAVARVIGGVGRLLGLKTAPPGGRRSVRHGGWRRSRVCPHAHCRNVEFRPARYCSRCGSRLE